MATQSTPRLLVELAPHSVQLALVDAGGRMQAFKECLPEAASVAAALAEIAPGGVPARVQARLIAESGFVMRANEGEATSIRTVKSLLTRAEAAPHGLVAPLGVTAFDSATGQRVDTVGASPWVLAATATAQVDAAKSRLAGLGLNTADVRLALPARIGAVVTALQDMPEATRVLVWQIGEADAQLACVSAGGCEAAGTAAVGFAQIFEAVQAGLGLKFRAAAVKLFFNAGYDFGETAGPIAERLAALLRPAIASLDCAPTALHVAGLPVGQEWLATAVATALDLAPLTPNLSAFCSQRGLGGEALGTGLPASALGLLFEASGKAEPDAAWQPGWLDANTPAVAAPAPVAVKPVVKPVAPVKPAVAAAAAPAPVATPAPVPVTAQPVPASSAALKPAAVVKPAAVAAAAPKPVAPAPVAKPVVAESVRQPVAAVEPQAEAVEQPAEEVAAVPLQAEPKKKPVALIATVAAILALGGVGVFMVMRGGGDAGASASAPQLSAEDARLREEENARMLAEEMKTPRSFRNERYSFEVSDRGFLRKLVGTGNRTLIDEFGWLELQGMLAGTMKPFSAGTMADNDYVPSINKTVRDGKVVFEIKGTHPRFTIETLVTCLPSSIRFETVFKPINLNEARGSISGVYMVKMTRQSLSLGQRALIEPGAVTYSTQSGPVVMKFNGDVWGQAGEAGKQTFAVGSNLVFFYFAEAPDPKNYVLTGELALP